MTTRRPGRRDGREAISWRGRITSVQPRVHLTRSFDQRFPEYLGYVLRVVGRAGHREGEFTVQVGEHIHRKHGFQVGHVVRGWVMEPTAGRMPLLEFDGGDDIVVEARTSGTGHQPPPWQGRAPALAEYEDCGFRRLDERTFDEECWSCIWGCLMDVEMIIDHWNPRERDYRYETFCYGPLSCRLYVAGPTRKVPGRKRMVYEEEDWVDEQETRHRGPDE